MRGRFFALLVLLGFTIAANAQTFRGAINGTVVDPSGAVVANVQVKATEVATGLDHTTVTTGDGQFAFQDIPLGAYKVMVSAQGFRPYVADKVQVTAGTIYTLAVKLSLGEATQTVEVSAASITVDTSTPTQDLHHLSRDRQDISPERTRLFTVGRGQPRLWRVFRGRVRIAEWHPSQPDELAD